MGGVPKSSEAQAEVGQLPAVDPWAKALPSPTQRPNNGVH
jgi:hypothetical protein